MVFTFGPPPQPPAQGTAPASQWSASNDLGGNIFYGPGIDTSDVGTVLSRAVLRAVRSANSLREAASDPLPEE